MDFEMGGTTTVTVDTHLPSNINSTAPALVTGLNTLNSSGSATVSSDLSTISGLSVQTMNLGIGNAEVFVGLNYGQSGQEGLLATGINVGFAMFSPTLLSDSTYQNVLPKMYALKASVASAQLVGFDKIHATVTSAEAHVNSGSWPSQYSSLKLPAPVVDLHTSFPASGGTPAGYAVPTGAGQTTYLDYAGQPILSVVATSISVDLDGFVHVSGSLDFERGAITTMTVDTHLPAGINTSAPALVTGLNNLNSSGGATVSTDLSTISGLEVQTMNLGIGSAQVFVGMNYGQTGQEGLLATGIDIGFAMFTPTLLSDPAYENVLPKLYALKASVASAQLVGFDRIHATLTTAEAHVNGGSWPSQYSSLKLPSPAVDFGTSFPSLGGGPVGYAVPTGAGQAL